MPDSSKNLSAEATTTRKPRRRLLAPGQEPHVALIIETTLASGRDILGGIARYVREHGPWSLFHSPRSLDEPVPSWLKHWRGHGIIARVQNRAVAEAVGATGLPVVDVLGNFPQAGFPLVHIDHAKVAQMAAEHLLELGFVHFGYVNIPDERWSQARCDAFLGTVRHVDPSPSVYTVAPRSRGRMKPWEVEIDEMAAWIRNLPKPLGVMVCSDQRGSDVMEACRRAGARVPDDVAVVGVDNDIPLCEVSNPPLSSVWPGHVRVGYEAAALLDRLMAGERPPKTPQLIPPIELVTRRSTEILSVGDPLVAAALRCMREKACEGIGVDEIARRVGASRSVLQRRFKAALDRTLHDELVAIRIRRATDLVLHTNLSMVEVAERSGFRHAEYMGVVFKSRVGKTPAQIRRENAAQQNS